MKIEPIPGNNEQYKRIKDIRRFKIYKKLD